MTRMNARAIAFCLGVTVIAAGCESATGARGETRIHLSRTASGSAALFSEAPLSNELGVEATLGKVPMADVASIEVTITRVQAIKRGEDEESEQGWVTLDVTPGARVNLLALPTETGMEIARGELPTGTYGNLRFFVEDATVTFTNAVSVGGAGAARTFDAGTAYPLRIPSSAQAGIRVPGESFTVAEDAGANVTVLFESTASVRSIQTTGNGLQMSPVLTARSR